MFDSYDLSGEPFEWPSADLGVFEILQVMGNSYEPFHMPVHKTYPSSMSIMIHCPWREYS